MGHTSTDRHKQAEPLLNFSFFEKKMLNAPTTLQGVVYSIISSLREWFFFIIWEDFQREEAEKGTEKQAGICNLLVGKGGVAEDKQPPVDNRVSFLLPCEGALTRFKTLSSFTESIIDNRENETDTGWHPVLFQGDPHVARKKLEHVME